MPYIRQGTCNLCGECCGAARSTDGGHNNAWSVTLVQDIVSWSEADVLQYLPIFKYIDRKKVSGHLQVGNVNSSYIFSTQYGLVKSEAIPECPALQGAPGDAERPCGLYGTAAHEVWEKVCRSAPPEKLDTEAQVAAWYSNCPSCSYTFETE